MKKLFKNKVTTVFSIVAILALAGVAIYTAIRLFQTRRASVSPTAPESKPQAAAAPFLQCGVDSPECDPNDPGSVALYDITGQPRWAWDSNTADIILEADGSTEYTLLTNVWHTYYGDDYIKEQAAWINYQGDNAGLTRGKFWWAADRATLEALPQTKGEILPCTCSNNNRCLPAAGYAVLEAGDNTGSDYIELKSCTSWSNPFSGSGWRNPANHVALFVFTVNPQWAPDGPNTLNDISVYAKNVYDQVLDWGNNDMNFVVPYEAPVLECSDGIDNDGDTFIDCTAGAEDPGCYPSGYKKAGETCDPNDPDEKDSTPPQCSDAIDNDGDGKIDCTQANSDPGCYPDGNGGGTCNPDDNDETDTPSQCSLSFSVTEATPTPAASVTPTPTPTPKASATPTATPVATSTSTATPTASATPAPELPNAGITTPALVGLSLGTIILIFSLVLAL